ncbi:hypothetical protein GCM10023213_48230 [Prosthecobacter algae]|uniref:Uncharacterized protein n=1 Tax=Prosthecobacter algae TaxID=1144682 RepID=A0ABP9PPA5_9BACT
MNEPDPEAQEKTATLDGHYGAEIQFQAVQARTRELVRLAFDFVRIIPASGAAIIPGEQPTIRRAR